METELGQKVIDRIKTDSLAPKPRWHFLLKEWLVWLLGGLALLVGAASVAVMRYLAENGVRAPQGQSFAGWLLLSLPYFWIILLALFLWIFYYNLKHTKRGYRYPMLYVAGLALTASIIFGFILYSVGVGRAIDDILGRKAPLYDLVFNPHINYWSDPEHGRLAGLVIARSGKTPSFVLIDRERAEWVVSYDPRDDSFVVVGQPVRAIGSLTGERRFEAVRVMRLAPGREYFQRFRPGQGMMMHR